MTERLRRALRRLDEYTLAMFNPVYPSLGRHYAAASRLSKRG
jgi:hypothetical protein